MLGVSREELPPGAARVAWWGKLSPRFEAFAERISVRWTDPAGRVRGPSAVERLDRPWLGSVLALGSDPGDAGLWSVEALIDDDVIDRRAFRVQAPR
jgi:hypothetical protein